MEKVVSASIRAALSSPDLMTIDNISALTKGHGGLNISAMCAANTIASEILKGRSVRMEALNVPEIEAEMVIREGVESAKLAGAVPSNAALLTAALAYIAGANVRAGCPAANRKLGAMARMIAGADKGGVLLIPTAKSVNKVSAFAAVHAIYHAMLEGKLTKVRGADLPGGVGGQLYGHGALGEDIVFPELTENAASIGTEAMLKAYSGVGVRPNPFAAAVLATAATMEVLHADAEYEREVDGVWSRVDTAGMAGRAAANTAKLPDKLHLRGTGEEFDTGRLIGDLGLMLKDIGTPTVVGMLAFEEIFACLKESGAIGTGSGGGPFCPPLAHQGVADSVIALRVLAQTQSMDDAVEAIRKNKETFIDPELATVASNTIARKTEEVVPGPATDAIIKATEAGTLEAVTKRVEKAFESLSDGKGLSEVVRDMEAEKVRKIETRAANMLEQRLGKKIGISVKKLEGGARRPGDFARKYYGFDINADVEVTIEGQRILLEGLSHKVIPDAVLNMNEDVFEVLPIAALPILELSMSPHTIINITVPVAVACAMKKAGPREAAKEAEEAAFITASIPGARSRAREVGEIALKFMEES